MDKRAGIYNKTQLLKKFDEIKNNPSSEKLWLGHTCKRWNSYLFYSSEPFILQLKIPALFIIGEGYRSVPVESVRYLMSKLKDRDNFRFHIIAGVDHNFKDHDHSAKLLDKPTKAVGKSS